MSNLYKISTWDISKGIIKDQLECDNLLCYDIDSLKELFNHLFENSLEKLSLYGDIENIELVEYESFVIENRNYKIKVEVMDFNSVYDIDPKEQLKDLFECVGMYSE